MLARRTRLSLHDGCSIDLPRLVPAFTSKGFPFFPPGTEKRSEVTHALELTGTLLEDSFLISAYDLHHRHLIKPHRFFKNTEVLFVDSGGYEMGLEFDSTEPKRESHNPKPFSATDYQRVLRRFPQNLPIVITNLDWKTSSANSIEDQILAAQELFHQFPQFTSDFILKPRKTKRGEKKGELRKELPLTELLAEVSKLRAFDIIGVTEKEIGKNLLARLKNLARLRVALDREGVDAPIHVWGGLDPVITPLYFFAGAEIFDGVSWLRYAYRNGIAVYRDCSEVLNFSIETSFDHVRFKAMVENLSVLRRLTSSLRSFVDSKGQSFSMFEWNQEALQRAYAVLSTQIPELKGAN